MQPESTLGLMFLFLAIVVMAPIGEEVVFRGFLQKFLEELDSDYSDLFKKLDKDSVNQTSLNYKFGEKDFRVNMLEDQMASEKLSEGITGFSKAIEELELLLFHRFSEINSEHLIAL